MIRTLIRQFSRSLSLNPITTTATKLAKCEAEKLTCYRSVTAFSKETIRFFNTNEGQVKPFDTDEYIIPYKTEKKQETHSRDDLIESLQAKYRMSSAQLDQMCLADLKINRNQMKVINHVLDILLENGVTKDSIVSNPWLLTINPKPLLNKLEIIQALNIRNINDFIPLLKLSAPRLLRISTLFQKEAHIVPGGNRIYFISDQLKLNPKIVSSYLSRRLFMLEMPFDMLYENLSNMMRFGVPPMSILRDLWAFRYTPKSVKSRLERAKNAKKDKIMPWMVRCTETILLRSLKLSLEEKQILGDCNSVVEYVAQRLNYDPETMEAIMSKHPATFRVRVTKSATRFALSRHLQAIEDASIGRNTSHSIKEILDYLLEEGYQPYEIAQVIRILCHSLSTTQRRLEELKSYNCRPSTLVIVCRSRKEYEKFLRNWIELGNSMNKAKS